MVHWRKTASILLALSLLWPIGAAASRAEGLEKGSGIRAVRPLRAVLSRQLTRLEQGSAAAEMSRLRKLSASAIDSASPADLEAESARLITGLAAVNYSEKDDWVQIPLFIRHLAGRGVSDNLGNAIGRIRSHAQTSTALRRELAAIASGAAAGENSPEALVRRLDRIFSSSSARETAAVPAWLGKIRQEPGEFSGHFIPPNERRSHLYAPVLGGRRGVLLSVGTFRGLNDLALGDFSHAVLLDKDALATAFNRVNTELIRTSPGRLEYLAALHGRSADRAVLESVRAGRMTESEFLRELPLLDETPAAQESAAARDVREALALARENSGDDPLSARLLRFAAEPGQWDGTYLGSDRLFSRVQSLARRGRIASVSADLAGPGAVKAVGAALRRRGLQVSAIDVSNVHYYLNGGWPGFIGNLESLPLSSNAAYLFTDGMSSWGFLRRFSGEEVWRYFATPARHLLETARASLKSDTWLFSLYIHRLLDEARPQTGDKDLIVRQ